MPGVREIDCKIFIQIYHKRNQLQNVEGLKKAFAERGGSGIQFNYVTYQKVTADEQVLDKKIASQAVAGQQGTQELTRQLKGSLTQIFSLKDLLTKEEQFVDKMINASVHGGDQGKTQVAAQLKALSSQVQAADTQGVESMEEMVKMVCKLRADLAEGLSVQKQIGALLSQDSSVVDEVETLSHQAMTKLVCQEYKGGIVTPRRLGSIIRRLVPDVQDLKKLLPQLKAGLLSAGMPLKDFLEMISSLQQEFKSENVVDILGKGAAEIGMSAEDLMKGITQNPAEAAKLIVLASEIQQCGSGDPDALSQLLTDYVERVSGKMASQSPSQGDSAPLDTIVTRIEKQFVDKLKTEGVAPQVLTRVEEQLRQRFPVTFEKAKLQWIQEKIVNGTDFSPTAVLDILDKASVQENDVEALKPAVGDLLKGKGMSQNDIQQVFSQLGQKLTEKKIVLPLPAGVISSKNTMYFLERQIKINLRYGYPVTCLMLSVAGIRKVDRWEKVTAANLPPLVNQLFKLLPDLLRDVDIIGAYETAVTPMPFMILPFTEIQGAGVVRNRIVSALVKKEFDLEGAPVRLWAVVSATMFEKAVSTDLAAFRDLLKNEHQKALGAAATLRPNY
jgi:type IV pilus biogenesis protein CpaD/CtpE